jgi:hypothetical protein
MGRIAGVLFVFSIFSLAPVAAQSQYRQPAYEECPQGRIIRQKQNFYPSTMTDCQVLDADTAVENDKIRKKAGLPRQSPHPPVIPQNVAAPVPVKPAPDPEPLHVDYENRTIGNWLVSAKQDRFGDGGEFIALTGDGSIGLAIRCLRKDLSIGLINLGADPKPLAKGDLYDIKFRVGEQAIVTSKGVAINERLIQVDTEQSIVKSIRNGRETAIRIEDEIGVSSTHIFNTSGARGAFADLSRECPLD